MSAQTTAEISAQAGRSVWQTVRRGLVLSPEITRGGRITLTLALVATLGRVVVPLAVQQTIDGGIQADGGPDVRRVAILVACAAVAVVLTGFCAYAVNLRLFRATEAGLMTLRVKAFRHVHDLSVLTQNAERRGSMVSRVTSDVDTISQFVQFGGLLLVLSIAQLAVATILMAIYSPLLTVLVWLCFGPLLLGARVFQRGVSLAYSRVRERVADLLGAVSEAVVGAATVRAYAVERRTQQRVDVAVQAHRKAAIAAQTRVALTFSTGVLTSGLTTAVVVVAGTWLGAHGRITLGELLAFLFLVQLFTSPVQTATDVLNELQNAVAGWRRVIAVLDTPADVADPGPAGQSLPRGPITVTFEHVGYTYPGGRPVLHDIDLTLEPSTRVAVVGETGSGKTTFAKLLTRLMDPVEGRVLIDGVDLREVTFASLRERVVLVPQEGFLFEGTVLDNLQVLPAGGQRRRGAARPDRARPARLGRRAAARHRHRRRPARRVALGRRAAAGRPDPGLPGRPGPAGPRRGHLLGRPGDRGPDPAGTRQPHPRSDGDLDRPPPVHGPGRGRGAGHGRRPAGRARPELGARDRGRAVLRAARELDRAAELDLGVTMGACPPTSPSTPTWPPASSATPPV